MSTPEAKAYHSAYMRSWRNTPLRKEQAAVYRRRYKSMETVRTGGDQALFEAICQFLHAPWPCSNSPSIDTSLEI